MTFLLAAMTAIGPATMDIYLASLPHIGQAMNASTGQVQLTLSLYLVGFALGQIFYGPLSDDRGRRPMLLAGFILYIAATAVCMLAPTIETLIVARIFQGLGAAGPIIIARSMVRDLHSGSEAARQLGLMSAIQGVAPICAPIAGGFLQAAFGWRSNFVVLELIGVILFVVALTLLPETRRHEARGPVSPRRIAAGMAFVARDRAFLVYVAMNALAYSAVFAFLSGASHILQNLYDLTSVEFGLTYALCSSSYIGGNYLAARLVMKLRLEGMLKLGSTVIAVAVVAQIASHALWPDHMLAIVLPEMLLFVGIALMVPNMMAAALTPFPDHSGSASSLLGFSQMGAAALTGIVLGLMLGNSAWPMILITSAYGLLIFGLLHLSRPLRTASREAAKRRIEEAEAEVAAAALDPNTAQ